MGCLGTEGEVHYTLEQKSSHCVLIKVQKRARCTCQAEIVVGSSFTPSVALLLYLSSTVHPIIDCHEFTRHKYDAGKRRPCYIM